jgi:hypothetical protein
MSVDPTTRRVGVRVLVGALCALALVGAAVGYPGLLFVVPALVIVGVIGMLAPRTALEREGACPHCGYALDGLRGDRCPECGEAIDGSPA